MLRKPEKTTRKKVCAAVTAAAFAMTCFVSPALAANPADSTNITVEQKIKFSDDYWIQAQANKEAAMKAEFQKGNYTAENPYVEVDPYGNNPLAALVMFKTDTETKVSAKVEIPADKSGAYDAESTFSFDFDAYTTEHYIPVYALFGGDNIVTLTVTDKAGTEKVYEVNITTVIPDAYNRTARTITYDKGNTNIKEGLNFVSDAWASEGKIVAFDYNGNYRVIFTNGGQGVIKMMDNGHMLLHMNLLTGGYYQAAFMEIDMMGRMYQQYLVNGLHHQLIQLENGNWLIDGELPNGNTTEDYFCELDYETGEIVRDWWLKDSMDLKAYQGNPYYSYNEHDWAHVNSFVQIPGEDAIWFSARHQDGVYLLNLETNEIDAIIAEDDADYEDSMKAVRLTPVITQADGSVITVDEWWINNKELNPEGNPIDWHNPDDPYFHTEEYGTDTPFEYTYGQHAVSLLPNGDLFIFDNGDGRSKEADKYINSAAENEARLAIQNYEPGTPEYEAGMARNYSRAVIYHYDLEAGTVEQVWQYGKERGIELYSNFICDVDYLGENHYLIDFGGAVAGDKQKGQKFARVIEVYNDEVISEFNVDAHCYRAERVNPYAGTFGEYDLNQPNGVQKGELLMDRAVLPGANLNVVKMTIGHDEYIAYGGGTDMDTAAYISNNQDIMMPVSFAANVLGADTLWNADNRTVTVTAGDVKTIFTIDSDQMIVNGEVKNMDTKAVIKDNRTMLPMSAVAAALNATADYTDGVITIQK